MNKVILGLILAVCILGMALVMLNERLGRKNDSAPQPAQTAQSAQRGEAAPFSEKTPPPVLSPSEMVEAVRGRETSEAEEALAPPVVEHMPTPKELRAKQEEEALKLAAEVQLYPEGAESVEREMAREMPSDAQTMAGEPKPAAARPAQAEKPGEKPATALVPPAKPVEKPATGHVPPAKPATAQVPPPKPAQAEKPAGKPAPALVTPAKPATVQTPPTQPAQSGKPASKAAGNQEVTKFVIYARDNGATVRVAGNGAMAWRSMILDNPPRVVVDMEGAWKFPAHPGVPKNDLVSNVRIGQTADKRTRVVIDLKEKPKNARVLGAKAGDGFDVRVDK